MTTTRLASVLALGLGLALTARSADLVTLAGKKSAGTLVSVDPQAVGFQEDGAGTVAKVPVKQVALVDLKNPVVAPAKDAKYDEVELTDGSVLRLAAVKVKGKAVEPGWLPGPDGVAPPKVDLPLGNVFWLMRDAHDPKARAEWKKLLASRGKRDLFVVRQSTGLSPLPGTVTGGSAEGDKVAFLREDGRTSNLPLTRATGGLVFNQPPRDVIPPTVCKVYDVFGNVWYAQVVSVAESGLKVTTVSGATVEYPSQAGVSKLDFSQGNVTYLSDLEAAAEYPPPETDGPLGEQFPFAFTYQKDRAIGAAEIVLAGKKYAKGISVPPDTALTYNLSGDYREFKAVAGILDGVRPDNGVLRLRIEADGRAIFDEPVSKKGPPKAITLNVKDVKELKIVVERDAQSALYFGNQINLGDARVQK
ncbi:MAG TPA: NPCBM/NEW2 domain-containing protein [Fimbriiglobus sp.]|nr:NPCBM/NEW2 domain-containing protein [Fimbriiglobus sp.]